MKKPIIGITTNVISVTEGPFLGTERVYVNRDYIQAVVRAGAVPLMLPIIDYKELLMEQLDVVDALILTGGQDVSPHHYNEAPAPFLEATLPERDLYEMALAERALTQQKPIFAICRGMQLINVIFGGTLYQDIQQQHPQNSVSHRQKAAKEISSHTITLQQDSWLHSVYNQPTVETNSFHHQAVKELAKEFVATAFTADGIIEAIERKSGSFIAGVQWHPEMMIDKHPNMQQLFNAFIEEVKSIECMA
jgi:putative glutamine amidotransferase